MTKPPAKRSGGRGQQKHAPTPLFNYRKRPRQAIVSDPQQLQTKGSSLSVQNYDDDRPKQINTDTAGNPGANASKQTFKAFDSTCDQSINNYASANSITASSFKQNTKPGLMNISGQFTGSGRGSVSRGDVGNKNRGRGSNTVKRNPERSVVQNPGYNNDFQSSTESERGRRLNSTGPAFNFQQSLNNNSTKQNKLTRKISQSSSFQTSGSTRNCVESVFSPSNANTGKQNQAISFSNNMRGRGGGNGDGNKFQTNKCWTNSNKACNQQNASSSNQATMPAGPRMSKDYRQSSNFKSIFDNDNDFLLDSEFGPNETVQGTETKTTNKMNTKTQAPDSSMRIFTCPISVLKSWTASKMNTGLVMFEVYGIVDSATVRDKTGTRKEFDLRDDTSSIKCFFYEIDRELPRLIRGQVHRVMATVDVKSESLKVLSVRLAEKEERQVCQLANQLSQRAMEEIAQAHNEP